jgi:hypothetical protein
MRQDLSSDGAAAARLRPIAAITLVALLLVFAAFDDITTDNAATFRVEYTFLIGSPPWLPWSAPCGPSTPLGQASSLDCGRSTS